MNQACRRLGRSAAAVLVVTVLAVWGSFAASTAQAAIEDPPDTDPAPTYAYFEDDILVRSGEVIEALGPDLMGDRINESVGSIEFNQTDVSLPGNNKLEVRVGRRLIASARQVFERSGLFGDWDLDIPHLYTVATAAEPNWYGGNSKTNFNRCSQFADPPSTTVAVSGGTPQLFLSYTFWDGYHLYVPGAGDQTLLARAGANANIPSDGAAYPIVTNKNWAIRCLPAIDNGAGEGFEAVSPDGVVYRFNHLVVRAHEPVRVRATTGATPSIQRKQVWLLPTQITDRFGNWVKYTYTGTDGWRVASITSSDGRSISFTYNGIGNRIQSVTDGTRTWTYAYGGTYTTLQTVTQPDQSQWRFSFDAVQQAAPRSAGDPMCDNDNWSDLPISTFSMTHPSGALGTFTLRRTIHGRTAVPVTGGSYCHPYNKVPRFFSTRSLTAKTLSGPGMPTQTWSYAYSAPVGLMAPCNGCVNYKTVTITDPEGDVTVNTYGTQFRLNEGLLLSSRQGVSGSTSLRTTTYAYAPTTTGPYPASLGSAMLPADSMSGFYAPQSQRTINQQGVDFTQTVTAFDRFARPLGLSRTNSLGASRNESVAYHDHTGLWVLGQVASRTVDQKVPVSRTFDAATATVRTVAKFGKLEATYTYSSDGTLYRVTDALNKSTTFTAYKRGLPQQVTFADGTSISAVVNNFGTINSVTNEAGHTWTFMYDAIGRLTRKTPPTAGDHPTVIWFVPVATAEYGLEPNHWRQTIMTGNAVTNHYFDARWRKRMTVTYDNGNVSATQRMQRFDYDTYNRTTFASYPARSITSITAPVPGTTTAYDALGRVTQTRVDSELGALTTTTDYLTGFQRRVTDARGKVTTTGFQVFDEPDESAITSIAAPEGLNVTITRDLLGKPTAITRSGTYAGASVSATRRYVYDSFQRLCKTIEPETGATVQQLDGANNVTWRATGLALYNAATCDIASVPDTAKVAYTYDARHRLTGTGFGDGSPAIGRSYTPDGLPLTVVSNGSTWTYGYNARRLLTSETLNDNGAGFGIGRAYDVYGHLAQLTYPDGAAVAFGPNALGEPTQVGSYATGVTYHPNGAVASYTLGNGIVHTLSQNTRGLPLVSQDVGVLKDQYAYDANGNVTGITDLQESIATRAMAYDGLDRLITANSAGVWGNASFGYDPLGNVRTSIVGSRSSTHAYSASTNLLTSVTSNGVATAYAHDPRGNVSTRGSQGFSFDLGNRLTAASGVATYTYDGWGRRISSNAGGTYRTSVYSQDGQLLYGQAVQGSKSWSTRHVYLQDKLIAETDSTLGTRYAHTDALGSPVAWTNASKAVTSRTRYEPYGKTAAGTNPGSDGFVGVGFTGHVNDAPTGLVYMQQRYYDPIAGRFLSVDPITTDANTGLMFNRYEYANNNPYRYIDPDGMCTGSNITNKDGTCASTGGFTTDSAGIARGMERARQPTGGSGLTLSGVSAAGAVVGGAIGGSLGTVAATACVGTTGGTCAPAAPAIVGAGILGGAAAGAAAGAGLEKAWGQLGSLLEKATQSGPQAVQYALVAERGGLYPTVRGESVFLNAGDVWKYGISVNAADRYSGHVLKSLGLQMEIQSSGTLPQVYVAEKIQLINYVMSNGSLPPGNKIFK
ncbi:RHS repeat domain-containing protein [Caldimonas sp. KR1-144]|uniref:RHS repeat domain-containing protein n=1 Tax=Caldimonas sp. KR1-144 TaxID=3400911 RepID=UPI003C033C92